jgi:DNA-binding NarL/FixJ family response regulator
MTLLLRQNACHDVAVASIDLLHAVAGCTKLSVDAFILGAGFDFSDSLRVVRDLLSRRIVRAATFLDIDYAPARAIEVLSIPGACYHTRWDQMIEIVCDLVQAMGSESKPLADQKCEGRSVAKQQERLRRHDPHGVLSLTARERQITASLVMGRSTKQTATFFGLAESTVDNHKQRVMRKLGIHRVSELVRIALKSGLVD